MRQLGEMARQPLTWLTLSDIPSRRTVPSPGNALLVVAAGVAAASLAAAWLAFPIRVTSNSMAPYVRAGDYGVAVYTDHKARRRDRVPLPVRRADPGHQARRHPARRVHATAGEWGGRQA